MRRHYLFLLSILISSACFTQVQINSSTFGMMEARMLGPGTMSGRITAIEGVNADGKTIYIGTAGGGHLENNQCWRIIQNHI